METTICKPVYDTNIFKVVDLTEDFREIQQVLSNMYDGQATLSSYDDDIDLERFDLTKEVQDVLKKKLDSIETQLNIYGYTMQKEPKEFQYHVNELKGDYNG